MKNVMEVRFIVSETNKEKLMKILSKAKAKIILCSAIEDTTESYEFKVITVMKDRKFFKHRKKLMELAEIAMF